MTESRDTRAEAEGGKAADLFAMHFVATAPEDERLPYVANVSLPRSGHHLFVRMLTLYFGPRFGYCEFYGPQGRGECCGRFPCARPGLISTSKNHDFQLDSELPPGVPLVVQIRRPLDAIVSDFELHVRNGAPDTPAEFARFAEKGVQRFRRFHQKWVEAPIEPRAVLWYEDLCADPVESFARAARIFGEGEIDRERAADAFAALPFVTIADRHQKVEAGAGVRQKRDVRAFRYYDEDHFRALEEAAGL